MSDWPAILKLRQQALRNDERCWLVTIIDVSGSAYRRLGAHLLVTESGAKAGNISAGCLERDVLDHLETLKDKFASDSALAFVLNYDNRSDDPYALNAGCSGAITLLIEQLGRSEPGTQLSETLDPVSAFEQTRLSRERQVVSTVIALTGSGERNNGITACRILERITTDERTRHASAVPAPPATPDPILAPGVPPAGGDILAIVREQAIASLQERRHANCRLNETDFCISVFHELMEPPHRAVVVGAQDDAIPLAELATRVGFEVHVADWRPALLTRERFPSVDNICHSRPEHLAQQIEFDDRTAVIIMTHDFDADKQAMSALAAQASDYVGLMGPRARTQQIIDELSLSPDSSRKLRFPIGLDIGATTPDQIAVSIIAELLAVFSGTASTPLKQKTGPIHFASSMRRVGIAILAAGAASRFGSPKQIARLKNGSTFVEHVLEVAGLVAAEIVIPDIVCQIALILGCNAEEIERRIPANIPDKAKNTSFTTVHNSQWAEGMSSSIRHAVRWAEDQKLEYLLFLACDQVALSAKDLAPLLTAALQSGAVSCAAYDDTIGVPACFPARYFQQLLELQGERGAKSVLQNNRRALVQVQMPAAAIDIDQSWQLHQFESAID